MTYILLALVMMIVPIQPVDGEASGHYGGRHHPILGYYRHHDGIDYRAPYGTPVVSVLPGVVVGSGWRGGYGCTVEVSHTPGGFTTLYAHLQCHSLPDVGQQVDQGYWLGFVGSTGLSTGPHLHFETRIRGRHINPLIAYHRWVLTQPGGGVPSPVGREQDPAPRRPDAGGAAQSGRAFEYRGPRPL